MISFSAFGDELVKISVDLQGASKKKPKKTIGERVGMGIGGAYLAHGIRELAGSAALGMLPPRGPASPDVSQQHLEGMASGMGLKQPVQYEPGVGRNAFHAHHDPGSPDSLKAFTEKGLSRQGIKVDPSQAKHYVSSHPRAGDAVLAHELGHAKNLERWGKGWRYGVAGLSGGLSQKSFIPTAAWAASQENPTWTPGLIQAGISAPQLIEEGAASLRAAKYFSQRGRSGALKAWPLVPAFASYATKGLTPLAFTGLRKFVGRREPSQKVQQEGQ